MPSFADRLRELRKSKNLTQKYMAKYLGLTERNYQRYEAGEVDPPTSKTLMLADFFLVSVDYLTGRDNYWQDSNDNPKGKVQTDICKLDAEEMKKESGKK